MNGCPDEDLSETNCTLETLPRRASSKVNVDARGAEADGLW